MSARKPDGLPPQAQAAWDFPLFDAIMGRRSRRFGLGMEMTSGPFQHKSEYHPYPLSDLETAMLVAAATATTGPILAETNLPGAMVKTIGKPYPSAMGSHRSRLFFTNDEGVFVVNADKAKMTKMREYETADDRDKLLGFYDNFVEKIDNGRMDLPPSEPGIWPHNQWVTNMPGTTIFMPVIDVTKDIIKLMINLCDGKAGRYAQNTGGYYIVDDRNGMRPCGNQKWVDNGLLNKRKVMTLSRLEKLLSDGMLAEGAFMGQLMALTLQATGLGGWVYGGFSSTVVLGGTPACRGLGFRFIQSKSDPFPIPVGRDGVFEAYCPPYFANMSDAVDAALEGALQTMDQWEAKGMVKPHTAPNAEFDAATIPASPDGIQCVKDMCQYIYETYGKFPATVDPIQMTLFIQAHHLDLDFYDKHMKPGAYLDTHKNHFRDWHGNNGPTKRATEE
ncbi:hypothetical protein [Ruegeria marina]|uniref:Uncharacterized protein n=1 Tax=Ruegeria marina TaxID=639004 RepID=A0A1G7EGP1_9RHOB|nr:hypothetical protein [Ruegeria marina]SDE62813.1 hypothetical protein SAMN04488239_12540 [Ruegeria marina]